MAPEQAAGQADVDHRADIYAIGAMLFEMVAGAPPFTGTFQQVVMAKMTKDAPSLAARAPAAPAALVRLIARCLERDPALRPATAEALLAELRTLARPDAPGARGRTRIMMAGGVVALTAVAVLGFLFARDRRARWVHETALPDIARLVEADQLDSAFVLAEMAAQSDGQRVSAYGIHNAVFDPLRADPRFAAVIRQLNPDVARLTLPDGGRSR